MPSGISVDFNRDVEHDIVVLPSNLYAYTDSSITGTQYYAWRYESQYETITCFTLSETPAVQADKYFYENDTMFLDITPTEIQQYDSSSTPPRILVYNTDSQNSMWMNRYVSEDRTIYSMPSTIYADSTNVNVGQTLYDDTGTDTGLTITTINQDSSLEISQLRTITWQNTDILHDYGTSITVNNHTLSYNQLYQLSSYTWIVPVNESTTIIFDGSYNGFDGGASSSNATYIPTTTWSSRTGYIATINFTMPNENLTFTMRDEID